MNEPEVTEEDKLIFRMTFSGLEKSSLMFLMKHNGFDDPKKLIRYLIAKSVEKIKEKQLTYGKGPSALQERKTVHDETIKKIQAMSQEELLAYVLEIGFVKDETEEDGTIIYHSIGDTDNNLPFALMHNKVKKMGDNPFYSYSVCDTIEKLINTLIKQKLI